MNHHPIRQAVLRARPQSYVEGKSLHRSYFHFSTHLGIHSQRIKALRKLNFDGLLGQKEYQIIVSAHRQQSGSREIDTFFIPFDYVSDTTAVKIEMHPFPKGIGTGSIKASQILTQGRKSLIFRDIAHKDKDSVTDVGKSLVEERIGPVQKPILNVVGRTFLMIGIVRTHQGVHYGIYLRKGSAGLKFLAPAVIIEGLSIRLPVIGYFQQGLQNCLQFPLWGISA